MKEIKKPIEIKLIFDGDGPLFFPESRLGIVSTGDDNSQNGFGQRRDQTSDQYSSQWSDYSEQWRTLLERDNDNDETLENSSEEDQQFFKRMLEYIDLDMSTHRIGVEDDLTTRIYSSKDLGDITVTIEATGANCF